MNAPTVVPAVDLDYRLADRFTRESGRIYATGTQALVRLVLEQAALDRAAGLNSAGFVSGYRGSPLGAVDQEMWRAKTLLERANVRFQPAVNEDLAATAILGTQRVETDPNRTVDGVFALWYGKGPGVDRAGDALKHGNAYGSSPHGGVLVVAGDDHGCVSSSMSHQSDLSMMAWSMPVIHPASIADYVPFGLWGWAASRFSGAWVGFKALSEVVEGAGSFEIGPRPVFARPDAASAPGGLHYRWPDLPHPRIEQRLPAKLAALRAFARANPLDRLVVAPERPRLLIVTVGKAHGDTMEALRLGGLPAERLAAEGVAVVKIGLVFPLDTDQLTALAAGVEEVLVVEEKAPVVERQLKEELFNYPADRRPRVVGKADEHGAPLIPETDELRPSLLAPALAARLGRIGITLNRFAPDVPAQPADGPRVPMRSPYFCSGCPHNTSTRVPEGSRAQAGIGCHFMANWMDRETSGIVQMGGEGVDWTGQAPFTTTGHVFQNLGDGTYFHSGHVAIRQAVSAGANITYKILYNDAVAMTGGQPVDGTLSVPQITRLVAAEGVTRIAVVSDDPARFAGGPDAMAPGVSLHHRDELDAVQRELREVPGVSVLVYDQTCAAEKRRRRKRKLMADPKKRVVINERVCEGCGDCQKKSNCLSVVPVDTEFGRKRTIDQASCNKDFSCVKGFCPSFVTVEGGELRRGLGAGIAPDAVLARAAGLPLPAMSLGDEPFEILVAGVGGTGIVTIGALITMAAHLEGRGASVLDFMGFAQKGGQVLSFVRLARDPAALNQVRIDRGRADAVLACDLVVASSRDAVGVIDKTRTRIVANTHEIPTGAMLRDPSARIDTGALSALLARRVAEGAFARFDAQAHAERLIGDPQQANVLLMGHAWQQGLIPVSLAALERAIELNGVAVEVNRRAFAWGRLTAADPDFVAPHLADPERPPIARTLEEIVARRVAFLTEYQDAAYAARYAGRIAALRAAEEAAFGPGETALTQAAARGLFRLMAYKDEYEVARLYTDGSFLRRIRNEFEGNVRLTFHLAPPIFARTRPGETEPRKMTFGPWMLRVFGVLAAMRRLRGTAFDPFGLSHERREERALIVEYEALIDVAISRMGSARRTDLEELLNLPETIRGFGPVKARAIAAARQRRADIVARLADPEPQPARERHRASA